MTALSSILLLAAIVTVNPPAEHSAKDVEAKIAALRSLGSERLADAIVQEIAAEKLEIPKARRPLTNARIIVGRIVPDDGKRDPREIKSQMEIFEDGWFVDAIGDARYPVRFRMEGYEPVDLHVGGAGKPGDVVWVGVIRMPRLAPENAWSMTFSVPESATVPFVHIVASLRPFQNPNTPDDKHEFRVRPTDHLFLGSIPPGGTKRFDGAVDGDYWVTLSADGYLGTSTWVDRTTTSPMTLRSAKGEKDAILVQVNAPAATVTATKTPAAPSRATVVNPPSDQRENVILAQIDNIRLLHSDQLAAALEKRLDAERAELATTVTSSPNGRVIVGRVVVVGGAIDPREVKAQMPIYEDGWFVEAISDAGKPVEFRLEGYKPVDVMVGNVGKRGSLVWIGTVGMAPLTNSGSKEQRPAASPAPTPAPAAGKIETASVEREISWLRENLEPALNFSDQSYASDDWEVPSSLIYKNRIRPNGTCWIRFDGHVSFAPSVSDSLSRQGEGKEKDCTINLARIPLVTVQSAVPHFTASDLEWRTPRHKALVVGDCVVDVDPRKEQIIPKASAALDRMAALCRGEAVSGTRWWAAP